MNEDLIEKMKNEILKIINSNSTKNEIIKKI